jgi:hypothetical protein
VTFNNSVGFRNTTFNLESDFWDSEFRGKADFNNATFNSTASFYGATFDADSIFQGASFNSTAYFDGATFEDISIFQGASFNDDADFNKASFNNLSNFEDASFNSTAYFDGATFEDISFFQGASLNSAAYFNGAIFEDISFFQDASFNIIDFSDAQFNKEAHFEEAQFAGMASFENVRFKEDALFENADFKGKLSLTRTRYNKLYIRWYNITGGLVYDDAAYMSLMKNFKDLGYYEDYDSCYFQYRSAHRDQPWPTVSDGEQFVRKTFIDYPLEWFYGYGTKPINAALFSLVIVLVFALFWWRVGLGGPKDKTRESLKDRTGESQQDDEEWLDGDITDILAFSATVFLSGTRLFIDPPPLPRIEGRSRSQIKKAFILERVLGALFSVLFFIAISGTIARAS